MLQSRAQPRAHSAARGAVASQPPQSASLNALCLRRRPAGLALLRLAPSSQNNTQQAHVRRVPLLAPVRVQAPEQQQREAPLVGEDAAAFDLSAQSLRSWALFGALLSLVLGALYVVSCFCVLFCAAAAACDRRRPLPAPSQPAVARARLNPPRALLHNQHATKKTNRCGCAPAAASPRTTWPPSRPPPRARPRRR